MVFSYKVNPLIWEMVLYGLCLCNTNNNCIGQNQDHQELLQCKSTMCSLQVVSGLPFQTLTLFSGWGLRNVHIWLTSGKKQLIKPWKGKPFFNFSLMWNPRTKKYPAASVRGRPHPHWMWLRHQTVIIKSRLGTEVCWDWGRSRTACSLIPLSTVRNVSNNLRFVQLKP